MPRVLMQDPDGCRLVEVLRQTVAAGPRALVQAVMPDPKSCHVRPASFAGSSLRSCRAAVHDKCLGLTAKGSPT